LEKVRGGLIHGFLNAFIGGSGGRELEETFGDCVELGEEVKEAFSGLMGIVELGLCGECFTFSVIIRLTVGVGQ
jgi:hypothetical protein